MVGFHPIESRAILTESLFYYLHRPMNNPPIHKPTDEEIEADIAARRFMHLLHHPEEQNRDGEQTEQIRDRVANGLAGPSPRMPLTVVRQPESSITIKLKDAGGAVEEEKPREIAPWMNRIHVYKE
jgi:hypothetical protein